MSILGGFGPSGTPCSQSFQDKWASLYIVGKYRLRGIFWLQLEVILSKKTKKNNLMKIIFVEKSLMNSRPKRVKFFNRKPKSA